MTSLFRTQGRQDVATMRRAKDERDCLVVDLHLNLKGEYFDAIKAGVKRYEYRLAEKWLSRLAGRSFQRVLLKRGYPKRNDDDRIIERPWRGYELQTIMHPHFGHEPVKVCAIIVNGDGA
jgi:hypothetical protein